MSVRYRTVAERRQDSVVHPETRNGNWDWDPPSPPKRDAPCFFRRRRIPLEILADLPESSVDPLPGEFEDDGGGVGATLASVLARDALYSGTVVALVGSRSRSVDYGHIAEAADPQGYSDRVGRSGERSLLCRECSSGTIFGIYHTPTSRRKTLHDTHSIPDETRWERSSLPPRSTFNSPPRAAPPPLSHHPLLDAVSPYHSNTFHCTPELRYKPVYFGDPRLRRFSCEYSEKRRASSSSGLQDFCRTMLAQPPPKQPDGTDAAQRDGERIILPQTETEGGSVQAPKLRSPKLVKEVLKRMSSHPSGRDPQRAAETFSDEEDTDFVEDKEAMRVLEALDRSLAEVPIADKMNRPVQNAGPTAHATTDGKDNGLQSDNLVEEVLLSERQYEKTHGPYSEKNKGREEMEESRRFMSLTADHKSKRTCESPAPPKPPRNYDSLPRGFKSSAEDSQYDMVYPLSSSNSGSQCSASPHQNYFVVVAIDFGTTYSGYAFCFTQDPDNIHMMRNWECSNSGVVNQKTPTTLLLDPEGRFNSFGYSARECYHDLEPDEAKKWLYFEKFKMTLHKTENLSRETVIYAANGKGLPALTVFGHALRYFKDHALQELSDQSATPILCEDVRWVVTVPAIWRQPAKQFMRNAAYEAGIASSENPEQLLIALEPEVASIFCRRLRMHQLVPTTFGSQRLSSPNIKEPSEGSLELAVKESAGMRYMVVDCGGGTVDITVHEIIDENGTIKELHKATGGPYGSVGIDLEFERLLDDLFGADFMDQFKTKRPAVFVDLMVSFEARKRNASPFKITPINIALPYGFVDYYKKTKNSTVMAAVKKYSSKEITWSHGMLRLEPSAMTNLFQPTLAAIRGHVSDVLESCASAGISYLFLVGGFAESAVLQKSMRDAFSSDKLKVIIPQGVSLAILKGAVLFGTDPTVVSSRRSRLTYGVGVLNRFIHGSHPPDKLVVKDGVEWCADVFDKFVLSDQSVCVGDAVIRRYTPARSGQACSVIHIYCSERDDHSFITDPGVKRCGTLVLDLSGEDEAHHDDGESSKPGKREIQTVMIFGDTELKVSALDVLTGRCVKAEVDFLNA